MENNTQRIERIKFIRIGFDRIKPDDIETYFDEKFKIWIFRNSDYKELKEDNSKGFSSGVDTLGFELTEKDFIKNELDLFDTIDFNSLNEQRKKQYNFYKDYLTRRLSGTILKGMYRFPFTSRYAEELFNRLIEKFGNNKNRNLANYSWIYHKMTKDRLIDNTLQQSFYFEILSENEISIIKIKGIEEIGNTDNKNLIYESAKDELTNVH